MALFLEKDKEKLSGFFFYKLSETVLIEGSCEIDFTKTAQTSSCKVPAILVTLYRNSNYFDRFSKHSH